VSSLNSPFPEVSLLLLRGAEDKIRGQRWKRNGLNMFRFFLTSLTYFFSLLFLLIDSFISEGIIANIWHFLLRSFL
jgi:pilus assembly protein TadC